MNTEHFNICAAVSFSLSAGHTLSARYIGDDGQLFAMSKSCRAFLELNGEFMTQNSGVAEIRLGTIESVYIGSTNPDLPHPDNGVTRR
jgi:hypothetical protein